MPLLDPVTMAILPSSSRSKLSVPRDRSGRSASSRMACRPELERVRRPASPSPSAAAFGRMKATTARSMGLRLDRPAGALSAYAVTKSFSRHEKIELTLTFAAARSICEHCARLVHSAATSASCCFEAIGRRTLRCEAVRCRRRHVRSRSRRGDRETRTGSSARSDRASRCGRRRDASAVRRRPGSGGCSSPDTRPPFPESDSDRSRCAARSAS